MKALENNSCRWCEITTRPGRCPWHKIKHLGKEKGYLLQPGDKCVLRLIDTQAQKIEKLGGQLKELVEGMEKFTSSVCEDCGIITCKDKSITMCKPVGDVKRLLKQIAGNYDEAQAIIDTGQG